MRRALSTLLMSLFAVTVGYGCSASMGPTAGPPVISGAATEDQTCTRDAQCVLVQDCCGCERQGRQFAVHRERVDALVSASRAECEAVSCRVESSSHRSCGTSRAVCRGGRCIPDV